MVDIEIKPEKQKDNSKAVKYIMGGLVLICFFLTAAYVNTPTNWTLNINMDNNTLEAIKTVEKIQDKNLQLVEDENALCKAYADLNKVQMQYKNNTVYYFIENKWIDEETLWGSCLR